MRVSASAAAFLLMLVHLSSECSSLHKGLSSSLSRHSSSATIVGVTRIGAAADSPDPSPPLRKAKKNKYSSFSKTGDKDDVARTIERIKREEGEREEALRRTLPTKGTTVPVYSSVQSAAEAAVANGKRTNSSMSQSGAPSAGSSIRRRPLSAPNRVVPDDPSTFGFSSIGVVVGPHGIKGEVKVMLDTDFADHYLRSAGIIFIKKPNRRSPRPIKVLRSRRFGSTVTSVRELFIKSEPEERFDESEEAERSTVFSIASGGDAVESTDMDPPAVMSGDAGANTTSSSSVYLVQFESVESRVTASAIKGYSLYVRLSDRPTLRVDEFMIRDLVGMRLYDHRDLPRSRALGVVRGVVPPSELCPPSVAHLMHSVLEISLFLTDEDRHRAGDDGGDGDAAASSPLCLVPFVPQICTFVDAQNRAIMADIPDGLLELTYTERRRVVIRGFLPAACASLNEQQRRDLYASKVFTVTSALI